MNTNLILKTDSYKFSHYLQYPPNTTMIHSYLESRGGKFNYTLFVGLQGLLLQHFSKPVTLADVVYAAERVKDHGLPFNYEGWKYIVEKHNGILPLNIRAVPEGTIVPTKLPLMVIENTDPNCYWLTNYVETLLMRIWYPITVATTSHVCRTIIKDYLNRTHDNLDSLLFKLHDFGSRGVSSEESACIGGFAHTVNFMGSDTFDAIEYSKKFYNEHMSAFSISATEHSTITSWTREGEFKAYDNLPDMYKDAPMFACVIDSFDTLGAVRMWKKIIEKVRANSQTVVLRPDSGDPIEMSVSVLREMDTQFGHSYNSKGYKLINDARMIYGDGISSPEVIRAILQAVTNEGYSAENIAFGMGGGLLQKCDRDTQKFAIKCSAAIVNGAYRPVSKDPITDPGKKSKEGFLDLVRDVKGKFCYVSSIRPGVEPGSEMVDYMVEGKIVCNYSLTDIRNRVKYYESSLKLN